PRLDKRIRHWHKNRRSGAVRMAFRRAAAHVNWEELRTMTSGSNAARKTMIGLLLAGLGAVALTAPAAAQDAEERLDRIEAQVRALQRTVFPGPNGRFFTPEVDTSADAVQPNPVGVPADTALTDVLARLDAL